MILNRILGAFNDTNFENFEKNHLDFWGQIPITSSISGAVRILGGTVELISGVGATALSYGKSFFLKVIRKQDAPADATLLKYAKHGVANIGKGIIEMMPMINLVTIPYNKFAPRFSYIS